MSRSWGRGCKQGFEIFISRCLSIFNFHLFFIFHHSFFIISLSFKKVIIIAGPTAVGKTATAIAVARELNTAIISADSRQCYRELRIGVARPSEEELAAVPHHFIASHSIHDEITAATFETFALNLLEQLFQKHDTVVMTGGTGLYIRAFCEGLDAIPSVDPAIRQKIQDAYAANGLPWLQEMIRIKDPQFFNSGEIRNPQRIMRALEVVEETGKSILAFRKGEKTPRNFQVIKTALELPREELNQRIALRVTQMIADGLVEEVRQLLPFRHLNALQTVGYTEIFDYLDGRLSLHEAVERITINTRQYAKRQMTWFRKDGEMKWFAPGQVQEIIHYAGQTGS